MSDSMRCFLAIQIPPNIRQGVEAFTKQLAQHVPELRWIPPINYHLTLKFLGQIPTILTDRLIANLSSHPLPVSGFRLHIGNAGAFPNKRRPRVLWLSTTSAPETGVRDLHLALDNRLNDLGFEKETKPFRPHLTLSRIKHSFDSAALWRCIDSQPFKSESFAVRNFVLMESLQGKGGVRYRVLQNLSLQSI